MTMGSVLAAGVLLCLPSIVFAQASSNRPIPPGNLEIQRHPPQVEPPAAPSARRLDPLKLQQDAQELSNLADSIPADIDQVNHGKLPKELLDKLKRIEKLSKRTWTVIPVNANT